MTPWRRVAAEHRSLVAGLALLALANVTAYLLLVRPIQARASSVAERARAAAVRRTDAEQDEAAARNLVTGKSKADEELATFYQKVLPDGAAAARRLTYARLPALARETNVRYEERQSSFDFSSAAETGLGRLESRMLLVGDYADIRRFIYQLETAPEFVIIDEVTIAAENQSDQQSLTMQLSTYFRLESNGT